MEIKFSPRQTLAYQKLESPEVTTLLYGGSKGGGKSVFGCYWLYLKCIETINRFKLPATKYPIPLCFLGRKQSVDLNDTTLETFKAVIPFTEYDLKIGEKEIIIRNAVKIQYGGMDNTLEVQKFQSAEYAYIFIDQAEEISRDDYALLRGTLRRKVNDTELDYKILLTANPAICWLKDDFVNQLSPGNFFVKALPSDNPFISIKYVENLKDAFRFRPELVEAYVFGNWDIMTGANIVIKPSQIQDAVGRKLAFEDTRRVVSCDPARFGDDETVIYVLEGGKIIDQLIYGQRSTMETAGNLVRLRALYNAKIIMVDVIGIGAGIVDRLSEMREPVMGVNVGCSPDNELEGLKYYNLRSQIVWEGGEKFAKGEVSLPKNDQDLLNQLGTLTYEIVSNGKIKILSKEEIKKKLDSRSPDRADALLLGLYGLKFITNELKPDFNRVYQPVDRREGYGWSKRERLYV